MKLVVTGTDTGIGKTVLAGLFNHWWDKSGRMERA